MYLNYSWEADKEDGKGRRGQREKERENERKREIERGTEGKGEVRKEGE